MAPRSTFEKHTVPLHIHYTADGPLPKHIGTFMKQAGPQIGVLFWQWQSDSDSVDFYSPEHQPANTRYNALAEALCSLLPSSREVTEDDTACVTSKEVEVIGSDGVVEWMNVCMQLFYGPEGNLERAVGSMLDITRWKISPPEPENNPDFINILLDALVSPVFYKDAELVYRHCNKAFEEYLGKSRAEILNRTVYDLSPPHLAEIYNKADLELLKGRESQIYETIVRAADGNQRNVIFNKSLVFNHEGKITGMIGIINDITERVRMETRLRRIMGVKDAIMEINRAIMDVGSFERFYDIVLDCVVSAMQSAEAGSIQIFDTSGRLKMVAANGLFAATENPVIIDLQSSLAWNAMAGKSETCFYIDDSREFARSKGFEPHEILTLNGIRSMLGAPILSSGNLIGFITVGSRELGAYDETDLFVMEYVRTQVIQVINKQALYEKNIYLARHDSLTGLFNRRHFEELFEMSRKRAQRYEETFHVVVIDLDHFKDINDRYGHQIGDEILIDFAKNMTSSVRDSDIVARYGGDEFILVFFNTTTEALSTKLEIFRDRLLTSSMKTQKIPLTYGFSYGISEYPKEGTELDQLTRLADKNMYVYKNQGKMPSE